MAQDLELAACIPAPVNRAGFNPKAVIPYGLTTEHLYLAMKQFPDFIGFVNPQLNGKGIPRFETMLMPANFSSMVGEFLNASIPKYCKTLVKNRYHNGHADPIPAGKFPGDAAQHAGDGIEIKGSRYLKGWQGHNPEDTWLMVFVFDSGRPTDQAREIAPKPFKFLVVAGAQLKKQDWLFAERSGTSRRTITASVTRTGYEKMMANWIYRAPA